MGDWKTGILMVPMVLGGQVLRVDFNAGGSTQAGWEGISAGDAELGDSWSKVFVGGVGLDVDAVGAVSLDQRDRTTNGGGAEAAMWRDFLFANGSFASRSGSGLRLEMSGLLPNREYPVRIWGFDAVSTGGRAADWRVEGGGMERLYFLNTPTPTSLGERVVTLAAFSDGTGRVVIEGLVSATNPSDSHNVFINGLEIGEPVSTEGPTGLELSNQAIAKVAPLGSVVGIFSSIDPTPDEVFVYTLVDGEGSGENGLFEIEGDELRLDRDLLDRADGEILTIRVRTTDLGGEWFERFFEIVVINDSDLDGLDDDWELRFFDDLEVTSGADDFDGDGLTNLREQELGTNPTLVDTDGDGLRDGDEVDVYETDLLAADTDGDGLSDGDEVKVYGTNPLLADSDGDGFSDALEIAEGTDPLDGADFPDFLLPLRVNEFLARNAKGIRDGFGSREDWIEIYNPNAIAVNLGAYFLTDDFSHLRKWRFPEVVIPAGGYRLIFASGKDVVDPNGGVHTNFSLSGNGEYLAIVRPDGVTVDDQFSPAFPEQFDDVSFGRAAVGGGLVFFANPTPGAANGGAGALGRVKNPVFSVERGFYDEAFELTLSSATPGAEIRFTLDGSPPTAQTGSLYAGPITVEGTSSVRAVASFPDWIPSDVETHSYLFVEQVVNQPTNPPGWPGDWGFNSEVGQLVTADYEMDPRVVNNTNGLGVYSVREALLSIPSVVISLPQADVTGGTNGLYTNPQGRFEKVCSVEYLRPDGVPGFQEDSKIESHGNSSRRPFRMQKHSLRLTFSSEVGVPKLQYPLFPDSEVETFNKLVLRACFTDSWALNTWSTARYRPNDSQYTRDVWMKESFREMGHASGHGNFVHLYVNGLYFGLHNLTERIEDDWFAEHLGGETLDWKVHADFATPPARWNEMMAIANGNIAQASVYEQIKDYLDLENFIDYMLLHFYADAEDWPTKNGYAAVNEISGDGRIRFAVWDQEIALDKFSWNRYDSGSGAGAPFQRLRLNAEFRQLFADRVNKHLFRGGALSLDSSVNRFGRISDSIDRAIVAESARWGDTQATTPYGMTPGSSNLIDADNYPPTINVPIYFTREQHWLVEKGVVMDHYLPILHDENDSRSIVRELRARNLYPSIDAPNFSQHGGLLGPDEELLVTATSGLVFYTVDGSDPRMAGGAINPMAMSGPTVVAETGVIKARALANGEWSALTEANFIVGVSASSENLLVSEIYFNPPGADESTEWIELMNISGEVIDLSGVSFSGIVYTFPVGVTLGAGERMVVVKDREAFAAIYETEGLKIAPGFFEGNLSNGGEEIVLYDFTGEGEILRMTYDDELPWPIEADGGGASLVLVGPENRPHLNDPTNWRASAFAGGSPGVSDSVKFVGDPFADEDGDGLSALLEHAVGSLAGDAGASPESFLVLGTTDAPGEAGEFLTVSFRRAIRADDVSLTLQRSIDLEEWGSDGVILEAVTRNDDGTETLRYRLEGAILDQEKEFVRLRVELRE